MRLKLDDFAVFVADWRRKPEQIAEIADTLGLGLDAIVFVDDNPAECAEVAAALPDVSTVVPRRAAVRARADARRERALRDLLALAEDEQRQRSYAARADAAQLRAGAASLEDFWRSLADARAGARPRPELARPRGAAHAEDQPVQPHARAGTRVRRSSASPTTR